MDEKREDDYVVLKNAHQPFKLDLTEELERAEAALRDVVDARNKVSMMLMSVAPSRENGLLELYEVIDRARALLPSKEAE